MSEKTLQDKVEMLEKALLDLGTQLFQTKQKMYDMTATQDGFLQTMHALRAVLDEKDLLTSEEFDEVIHLENALEDLNNRLDVDHMDSLSKSKKFSH